MIITGNPATIRSTIICDGIIGQRGIGIIITVNSATSTSTIICDGIIGYRRSGNRAVNSATSTSTIICDGVIDQDRSGIITTVNPATFIRNIVICDAVIGNEKFGEVKHINSTAIIISRIITCCLAVLQFTIHNLRRVVGCRRFVKTYAMPAAIINIHIAKACCVVYGKGDCILLCAYCQQSALHIQFVVSHKYYISAGVNG